MNCEQIPDVLDAFLNGRMSGEASRAVRMHLASCASCASQLSLFEKIEIVPALDREIDPPADFAARFQDLLQRRKKESDILTSKVPAGRFSFSGLRPWQLAATGALAALLTVGIFLRFPSDGINDPDNLSYAAAAENLSLLQDMPVINNLDFLENFETIEEMTMKLEGSKEP